MPNRPNNPTFAYFAVCFPLSFCSCYNTHHFWDLFQAHHLLSHLCSLNFTSPAQPALPAAPGASWTVIVYPFSSLSSGFSGHMDIPSPSDMDKGQYIREMSSLGVILLLVLFSPALLQNTGAHSKETEPYFISWCINMETNPHLPPVLLFVLSKHL